MKKTKKSVTQKLAEKTFREIGLDPITLKPIKPPSRRSPVGSRKLPFRIPTLEKTRRQATKTTGYKASAVWQTASLLRDLLTLWFEEHPHVTSRDLPLFSRLKGQVLDAARSVVSTFEEGWARPTTKEFLDFIGFSQGSLAEIGGDIERMRTDGLLRTNNTRSNMAMAGISTPSKTNPYPPINSRKFPSKYGSLREKLREFTGKEIKRSDLTYEIFIELINKTNYLMKRVVEGLHKKAIRDEKGKLKSQLQSHWRKNW